MKDEDLRKFSLFPKTLSQVIEPLTRPVFKAQGPSVARLLLEWPGIVGNELASHTHPEKITFPRGKKTDGCLTIAVENGFATDIQHIQPLILERLATYSGHKGINRLAIKPAFIAPSSTSKKPKSAPPLAPTSVKMTENVTDNELKEALTSLAKTLSGQTT